MLLTVHTHPVKVRGQHLPHVRVTVKTHYGSMLVKENSEIKTVKHIVEMNNKIQIKEEKDIKVSHKKLW